MKHKSILIGFSFSMARTLLRGYWSQHIIIPPCDQVRWTCEHIVPRSLIQEHNDLHNLLLLPDTLNNARSNFPYIMGIGNGTVKEVAPCKKAGCHCDMCGSVVSKHFFVPPDQVKGMIARSVLYMKDKYPHHTQLIHNRVLHLDTALLWNDIFPATQREIEWDDIIFSIQHDHNHYTQESYFQESSSKNSI